MAVKVHCSICDKFIKDVDNYEFQKLTGKEMCNKCGAKVSGMYQKIDNLKDDFAKEAILIQQRMKKTTESFNKVMERYSKDIASFYTTRTAEIDSRMQDILEGKK